MSAAIASIVSLIIVIIIGWQLWAARASGLVGLVMVYAVPLAAFLVTFTWLLWAINELAQRGAP